MYYAWAKLTGKSKTLKLPEFMIQLLDRIGNKPFHNAGTNSFVAFHRSSTTALNSLLLLAISFIETGRCRVCFKFSFSSSDVVLRSYGLQSPLTTTMGWEELATLCIINQSPHGDVLQRLSWATLNGVFFSTLAFEAF